MKSRKVFPLIIVILILIGNIMSVSALPIESNNSNHIKKIDKTQVTTDIKKEKKVEAISLDSMEKPPIDITLGNQLPLTGYFTRNVTVGDDTRTVKIYVAPETTVRDYFTVIAAPEGMTTEEFLLNSKWFDIADEQSEGLFILEPDEEGWGTVEEELEYVNEAIKILKDKTYYNTFGVFYLAGYGKGGTVLQAWAMENPLFVISQVFVQTEDLSNDFIAKTGSKTFTENSEISYSEVPVPTWFVNDDLNSVKNLIAYWKEANDCVEEGRISSNAPMGSTVFMQDENSDRIVTSYSDVSSKVAVLEKGPGGTYNKGFTKAVYDSLSYYTRYDNTSINGNVLGVRPDYDKMGVEIKQMVIDGYTRDYLVYVPKSAPKKNIPIVYVLAGNTQTCRVFFDATHWWEVADEYGFMLVMPSEQYSSSTEMTWNVHGNANMQDDFIFLEEVIKQIDKDYNTNPGRRYATGQSLGSMFCNYATMVMPEYFAAMGSTSGPIMRAPEEKKIDKIPFWLFFGEYDIWSWDHTTDGLTNNTVLYWLDRNNLGEIDDAIVSTKDRYTTYTWYDGNSIPMYKYTQTAARSHNCIVSEMWEIWEEWFSHWEMDEEGFRHYIGETQ